MLADFLVSAAVAEFKGPNIFGVVRFAQVSMELARIEANFTGLSPGIHSWCINEYGDLTNGAASTGNLYNPLQDNTNTEVGQTHSKNTKISSQSSKKLRTISVFLFSYVSHWETWEH